jgi:transposase-like protein
MVLVPILCPHCESDVISKFGRDAKGKQRYLCNNNDCSCKTFVGSYKNKACDPKIRAKVLDHAVNGTGIRATGRILGIAKDTVTSVLKKQNCSYPR